MCPDAFDFSVNDEDFWFYFRSFPSFYSSPFPYLSIPFFLLSFHFCFISFPLQHSVHPIIYALCFVTHQSSPSIFHRDTASVEWANCVLFSFITVSSLAVVGSRWGRPPKHGAKGGQITRGKRQRGCWCLVLLGEWRGPEMPHALAVTVFRWFAQWAEIAWFRCILFLSCPP